MTNTPICPTCKLSNTLVLKYNISKFVIYFCNKCNSGFTYPIPKDLSKYYHSNYWVFPGIVGLIRVRLYDFFQLRRVKWVTSYLEKGEVLDIGSGEGLFGKSLPKNFEITNIDTPFAKIKNKDVLKKDFLSWKTAKKFDAVVFWESLEHTSNPSLYLQKAKSILKRNGYIFVEYPVFNCFESQIFNKYWFHLDPPRHLIHLTKKGIEYLAHKNGLKVVHHQDVFAVEYACSGFTASVVNLFNISSSKIASSNKNFLTLLLIPLVLFSLIAEYIFFTLKQSPIGLIVLKYK